MKERQENPVGVGFGPTILLLTMAMVSCAAPSSEAAASAVSIERGSNGVVMRWSGDQDQYTVLFSETLSAPISWQARAVVGPDATETTATAKRFVFTDETPGSRGFYQISASSGAGTNSAPASSAGPMVSLDFDDGWNSAHDIAFPKLTAAGLKATFYIVTGRMGAGDYMDENKVRDLFRAGEEVGAHTVTHRDLTTLSADDAFAEIKGSRDAIRAMGAGDATAFNYPFGAYDSNIVAMVKSYGFEAARTSDGGYNKKGSMDPFRLKRQGVQNTTAVSDITGWVDTAIAKNVWLVIVFHKVGYGNTQYEITPENLDQVIAYVKGKGVPVVTATEGVRIMTGQE